MKTVIAILFCLLSVTASAQDVDTLITRNYYQDTLVTTGGVDTIQIAISNAGQFESCTLTALTTTGTDTILVYTLAPNGVTWVQAGLIDLGADAAVTFAEVTTAGEEFLILGAFPTKVRLVTVDVSASCIIILSGKGQVYW